jgi:hypothetical protein
MREALKMFACFLAGIGWAMVIQKWAPDTTIWLFIGLVPALLLVVARGFFAIRSDSDVLALRSIFVFGKLTACREWPIHGNDFARSRDGIGRLPRKERKNAIR